MKKTILLVMTILALCSFAGCGSGDGTEALPTSEAETQSGASASPAPASGSGSTDAKALVVYFSWSGNTEAVAAAIQSNICGCCLQTDPRKTNGCKCSIRKGTGRLMKFTLRKSN